MSTAESFTFFGKGNGFNTVPFGSSVSVRPYVQPNPSSNPQIPVQGFLKFRTLGGYDQDDTGAPTAAQINKSLFNAMKLFYNAKEGGSSTANATLGVPESYVSASISSGTLQNPESTAHNPTFYTLTPKERAINSITGKNSNGDSAISNDLQGNRATDFYEVFQEPYSSGAICGRYKVKIVRLLDTTVSSDPVFLGYGLESHAVSEGGSGFENIGITSKSYIGSYFNPDFRHFADPSDFYGQVDFDISTKTIDDIPLLVMNESTSFDGTENGDDTTSSTTSTSAQCSIEIANGSSIEGNCTINADYSFYTY